MKFYKYLYIDENIKKPERVIWKLKHFAGQLNIYIICMTQDQDQLEFYHAGLLKQKYYKKNPPYVVGIANGYEGAMNIVNRIADETVKRNGTGDIKQYLLDRLKEEGNINDSGDTLYT